VSALQRSVLTRLWPIRPILKSLGGLGLLIVLAAFAASDDVRASDTAMKGPRIKSHQPSPQQDPTSSVDVAFLGAIRLYQLRLSPIGGPDRCGFRPSCSTFSTMAIKEEGPLGGLLMTADRLIRCHIWKKPGPDYPLLPNGKLYDPPSRNLLCEP